jgi:hypothetical protein
MCHKSWPSINLVPMGQELIWEKKLKRYKGDWNGKQAISDMLHIICIQWYIVLFSSYFWYIKIYCCLPKFEGGRKYVDYGFHFIMAQNHYSNLKTCKYFVHQILVPYFVDVVEELSMSKSQIMILLIDYWSIHTNTKKFRLCMKDTHRFVSYLCRLTTHED